MWSDDVVLEDTEAVRVSNLYGEYLGEDHSYYERRPLGFDYDKRLEWAVMESRGISTMKLPNRNMIADAVFGMYKISPEDYYRSFFALSALVNKRDHPQYARLSVLQFKVLGRKNYLTLINAGADIY